mmetsp:Transcript_10547/g.23372  ORF Transcript_10547/g.23372 Transcript_10547/m.23372 type:complete len:100 (+) Transcript_10547:86-385(+)
MVKVPHFQKGLAPCLADALERGYYDVEAMRLVTKLADMSNQMHGPNHQVSEMVEGYQPKNEYQEVTIGTFFVWSTMRSLIIVLFGGQYKPNGLLEEVVS